MRSDRRSTLPVLAASALLVAVAVLLARSPTTWAATTIAVTTLADAVTDDADCSLREAILLANGAGGDDCGADAGAPYAIDLVPGGTYQLTRAGSGEDAALTGDLDIAAAVSIGASGGTAEITAAWSNPAGPDRIFDVLNGASLTLQGITVSGGETDGDGGGIRSMGALTAANGIITGNSAQDGAGVWIGGSAAFTDMAIAANDAVQSGGGIFVAFGADATVLSSSVNENEAGFGGGIANLGTLEVSGSTVDDNVTDGTGGGILNDDAAAATISGSSVNGNSSLSGGGIYNENVVSVSDSTISDNTATSGGGIDNAGTLTLDGTDLTGNDGTFGGAVRSVGTLTMSGGLVSDNAATDGAGLWLGGTASLTGLDVTLNHAVQLGGGLYVDSGGDVTVALTSVTGNDAGFGGGIANRGTATVDRTTIADNTTDGTGGGVQNLAGATATLTATTVSGNQSVDGGGIWSAGTLTLANSTISANAATFGGGIYTSDGASELTNVTVSGNSTAVGGALYAPLTAAGVARIGNTIVADQAVGSDCAGTPPASAGNNLDGDGSCVLTGAADLSSGSANLGALGDHGGSTWTHDLLAGSDAIDAGNESLCAAPPVGGIDQRGIARPQGSHCDIGAFELEVAAATPTPSASPTASASQTSAAVPSATPTPAGVTLPDTATSGRDGALAVLLVVAGVLVLATGIGLNLASTARR